MQASVSEASGISRPAPVLRHIVSESRPRTDGPRLLHRKTRAVGIQSGSVIQRPRWHTSGSVGDCRFGASCLGECPSRSSLSRSPQGLLPPDGDQPQTEPTYRCDALASAPNRSAEWLARQEKQEARTEAGFLSCKRRYTKLGYRHPCFLSSQRSKPSVPALEPFLL